MNEKDRKTLQAVRSELSDATMTGVTQHDAMTRLLWAHHLLGTLLRQMQDD